MSGRRPLFLTNFILGGHLESGGDFRASPPLTTLIEFQGLSIWLGLFEGEIAVEWKRVEVKPSTDDETDSSGRRDRTRDPFYKSSDIIDSVAHKISCSGGRQENVVYNVSTNRLS